MYGICSYYIGMGIGCDVNSDRKAQVLMVPAFLVPETFGDIFQASKSPKRVHPRSLTYHGKIRVPPNDPTQEIRPSSRDYQPP